MAVASDIGKGVDPLGKRGGAARGPTIIESEKLTVSMGGTWDWARDKCT